MREDRGMGIEATGGRRQSAGGDERGLAGMEQWDLVHRWHWFHRRLWQAEFREGKVPITRAIAAVLAERGLASGPVLDCACGLGLQAITLAEAGLEVDGADRSAFAVARAQELAREEGREIRCFVSLWQELPARAPRRYDALFCDALPWVASRRQLARALAAMREALRPGGVLIFLGAPAGSTAASYRRAVREWWRTRPRFSLDWRHGEGGVTCTGITVGELGSDWIDWHLLFLVEEAGATRLERATIRESKRWHWQRLTGLFAEAGFSDLATVADQEWSSGAMPAGLHVATR
jgi:SAM-dependent methyltransferase